VLTCSGGDSGVAGDLAAAEGIELPALSAATERHLAELLPDAATIANPLDYTAMIWGQAELLRELVATVGADDAIDQLLLLYDHPAEADASWTAVREGLIAGAQGTRAASIIASTLPDLLDERAALEFSARGLPAIAGLRSALLCARALRAPFADPARLREIAAVARAAASGGGGDWIGEAEAKELLRGAGLAVPAGRVAADVDDAVAAAAEVGWPVALKLSSPSLLHKSDAGAIALNLSDEESVREAAARLLALPVAAGAELLVERMAPAAVEVFLSVRTDGVVPALALGLGGIWAEALDEVAIVPLPAGQGRVRDALEGLRSASALAGGRGVRAVDLDALAALAARVGGLAIERGLSLLELNPVAAGPEGCVILDAIAVRAPGPATG
jgi:acetyl-CoA synthetase